MISKADRQMLRFPDRQKTKNVAQLNWYILSTRWNFTILNWHAGKLKERFWVKLLNQTLCY